MTSPSMLVSKTHAFVDADSDGTIRITDCNSTNGTRLMLNPPVWLKPLEPTLLPRGTVVMLGEVACAVDLDV